MNSLIRVSKYVFILCVVYYVNFTRNVVFDGLGSSCFLILQQQYDPFAFTLRYSEIRYSDELIKITFQY